MSYQAIICKLENVRKAENSDNLALGGKHRSNWQRLQQE